MRSTALALALLPFLALAGCGGGQQTAVKPTKKKSTLETYRDHVRGQLPAIEKCYQESIVPGAAAPEGEEPSAEPWKPPAGEITLTLGIAYTGVISEADVFAEAMPELFVQCVADSATTWPAFPARKEFSSTIRVGYPIQLTPTQVGVKVELKEKAKK